MSVEQQFETEVLELAVRRVRTPEGAEFYGLPIGAPITADVIAAKQAEAAAQGITPPKGALSKGTGSKGKFMSGTISGKAAAEKSAPKPQAPKPLNLKVVKPTLSGNQHFSIGKSKYSAPNGSKLIRPASQPNMAYVVTPEGKVHAFNEQGEVPIPKPLDQIFAKKFGEGFEGDDEYAVEEFEASSASHALPDLKVGSVLTDAEGTPQFKKLGEDVWEHVDLGVKLKDEDLQELYDDGELIPDATDEDNAAAEAAFQNTEAMNFSEMTMQEAQQALLDLPVGRKITVGDVVWEKTTADQFTNDEGKAATPVSLGYVKNQIKIGADPEPEYNPLDGDTKNPLDENPPKLIGDTPDADWIKNAKPGAQMDFGLPGGSSTTTWTKDEEGTGWTNQKGGKLSQEALLNAFEKSGGEGLTIKKEGKEPKGAAASKQPDPYDVVEDFPNPDAPKIGRNAPGQPELTPEEKKAINDDLDDFEKNGPKTQAQKAPKNEFTEDYFANASDQDNVYIDGKEFWFDSDDGYWYGDDGNGAVQFTPGQMFELAEKGEVSKDAPEAPSSEAAPETPPKFGDFDYFDQAPDGDVVWYKGKPYTMDPSGMWVGNDGSTLGSGQIKKLFADGEISDVEKPYTPNVRDLNSDSSEEETLAILTEAAEGTEVHPVNSDATLTKVNADADQVKDYFGDDAATQEPGGYWQSSVTGKILKASELAKYWHGELQAGPGANPSPLPLDQKVQNIDAAESLQEMADWLAAANPGTQVSSLTNSGIGYAKTNTGKYLHSSSGLEFTPLEVAQAHWSSEYQMSELKFGPAEPVEESNPIDAIPDDQEFNDIEDAAAEGESGGEDSEEDLPPGIPAGFVQVSDLADVPVGQTMYEYHPVNGIYTHKKVSDNEIDTFLPDGFKVPGNPFEDVQWMMQDDNWVGKFFAPPAPLPAGVPEGSKPWDGNWSEWSDGLSLYAVDANPSNPDVYEFVTTDQDGEFLTYGPGEDGSFTYADNILDMLDGGSHEFYVGAPTKFAQTPDSVDEGEEDLGWKPGDILDTPEAFDQVPVNTKLAYLQKSGKISYYATLGNGMVLTPGGNQMPVAKMSWAISQGNVSIHELPEGAPDPADTPQFLFSDGSKITDLEQINAMAVGQKLEMVGADGNHLNFIIKGENGVWAAPDDDPNWPGLEFTPGDLVAAMKTKGGGVFYVQTEGVDNLTPGDISFETPAVQKPELEIGGTVLFEAQMKAALDALEAHSSFHVAYGLKSLPGDHPLTDPPLQNELKAMAMDAHPDLKAKPAVMQFLKDKLGIKDPEPNWEDALMEAAPKIHLGSLTPKKVGVQGMDGGDYTAADIQDAINILEAYPGKLFKNELNKKGNPLGELDPTQLVGFDKDKLVTKQKYIDLLKTKLVVQEDQTKHPIVKDMEEFKSYPVGTSVRENVNLADYNVWTKISENQWHLDSGPHAGGKDIIANESDFDISVKKGDIKLDKLPDVVPDYAKVPAAVKDKEKEQLSTDAPDFSLATMQGAEIGTKMHWGDGSGNRAEKTAEDEWTIWDADGNKVNTWTDEKFYNGIAMGKNSDGSPNAWQFDDVSEDQPSFNANQPFAIIPGKYSTENGKAFMVVHADGSGTHYSPTGIQTALTAEKVKKNYDAGMKKYGGLVSEADLPTPPDKKAAKKPVAKKPKTISDIADGTYFGGNPNDPKATIYEVNGSDVKVYKAAQGLTASTGVKIGGPPQKLWAEMAGFGASYESDHGYYAGAFVGKTTWKKGKDGMWTGTKGDGTPADNSPTKEPPVGWGYTVTSHGMSDAVTMPKAKVNTLFAQGQLADQYGNAVIPEDYTGSLLFFGYKTNVPALVTAQKWVSSDEAQAMESTELFQAKLKEMGVLWSNDNWKKWRIANGLDEPGLASSKKAMAAALDEVLTGVDTEIPEADTTGLFEWNEMGQAVMPLSLVAKSSIPYGKAARGEWIKEASKAIGDGKVIGLHLTKMDEWDRGQWISYFKKGDFAALYNLEVAAAALEGKAHGSGYLHPGFPDNANTNKIAWSAGVPGEISALDTVEGNWSSAGTTPSMEEVDNYLIKAQMQNPTYLTATEKRAWYDAHKNSNKDVVDTLSATAALRKKNGEAEQTPAPVWTDNVKAAKSYDILFESDALPVLNWTSSKGLDYVNDHPENAELQAMFKAKQDEGYTGMGAANSAVSAYFQAQKDAHEAELAKVFYQKSPNQKVKKGTHPIYEYDDFNGHGPLGNHYFFKPSPQGDAYRSEAEHLGHEYGWVFGFKTAGSQLIELDGKYGQLQKDLGSKSSLAQFDLSTLNANQIADIGKEHLLDWFLDNDDTHSENMQMMPDGSLVGIDKGRAFKHFGKWQGLNPDAMNSNAQTIYSKLFNTIKAGKLSKEDVDKAYLQIQKRAKQMSKVSDEKIADMLAKGMAKRKVWDVSYKIDGVAVGNNLNGLTLAVLDRKNKLPEQIEQMWAKIYKDAGFGDLPEPPAFKLGEEHHSGLDEAHFHENAFKVGSGGVSTLMAGDFSTTGAAIAWNTVNKDGSKDLFTQVELNHLADAKVYSKLQSMNPDATDGSNDPTTFDKDEYGGFFSRDYYRTMATLAKHNDDKAYNQDRIAEYQAAKVRLAKDLDAIQQNALPTVDKDGRIKFPSGAMVPQNQLGQYRMMLEFYQGKEAAMDATIATQADFPASAKAKFEPYPLAVKGKNYSNSAMGAQLTQLANGDFVYSDPDGAKVVGKDAVPDMLSAVGGWQELAPEPDGPKSFGGANIQLVNQTFETKGTWDNDTGVISTGTASVGGWAKGSEFKITLPTGETIYFRNRAKTSTLHSQYGRLTIKVPNANNASDYAAGVERAQDWLSSYLDLDMQGADEDAAELIYWKQMLPTLTRRKHKAGSKYAKAFDAVKAKATELGITTDDFPYRFGEFATPTEQNEFYRKVWGDQFGKDKIDKLISDQAFMPKYEGTDLYNQDAVQGRPIWTRFDIDLAEMLKSNPKAFVASHNTGGNSETLKSVAVSGSHLSTEERIRFFGGSAGGSSSADQQSGSGGQDQFTRIWDNESAQGYDFVFHPSVLLHTNTRFFGNDAFGAESSEKDYGNPDPMDWWKNKTSNSGSLGGGNQLDIRWASSWLNSLEMVLFDNAADRDYAIQKLKKAGLEIIRGLPVEDRLVMRQNRAEAIAKLRAQWQKEAGL